MPAKPDSSDNQEGIQGGISQAADIVLEDAASRLKALLVEMASALKPFPPFLNMVSVQAVELDPPVRRTEDLGCVVVAPDGTICSLDLHLIPGAPGDTDSGQVAEMQELDLPPEEYILYASEAIHRLNDEMRRRGL